MFIVLKSAPNWLGLDDQIQADRIAFKNPASGAEKLLTEQPRIFTPKEFSVTISAWLSGNPRMSEEIATPDGMEELATGEVVDGLQPEKRQGSDLAGSVRLAASPRTQFTTRFQ